MIKIAVVFLAAAALAVAQSGPEQYDTATKEYVNEFFKLVGHGQTRETRGNVDPERITIRLHSGPDEFFKSTLKNWETLLHYPQFNASLESKFFIHGWLESNDVKLSNMFHFLYAIRGKRVNYFTVDWSEYSYSPDFSYVAQQVVPKVAEYLYPMVQKTMEKQQNNRVHLVGFDMGAHMAGIVGQHVQGPKIARITGLSPAGRQYNEMADDKTLTKGDAEYVDIIHTNMGGAGITKTLGHVNFLPAGGRQQPAAETKTSRAEKDVISHLLARNYFMESVEVGIAGFIGKKCDSYTQFLNQKCAFNETEIMGEPVSRRVNGTVYMTVNEKMKPYYSKGIYGIYPYPAYPGDSYSTSTSPITDN